MTPNLTPNPLLGVDLQGSDPMKDNIKSEIRPFYHELQAYLSQTPLPQESFEICSDNDAWINYNNIVQRLSEITGDDYARFIIKPKSVDGENVVQLVTFRQTLGRIIDWLHVTYFSDENRPFSGSSQKVPIDQTRNFEKKIFLVHGHDTTILHQVARLLEQLDIEPIVLFEQPGKGQTIIEKLESNSNVAFAVVILTPDDVGKALAEDNLKPRARQNVVFELGYFIGRLNRTRVSVLYDESIELPSDYRGVEYIKIDIDGAWKLKLAKEMKAAGLDIDMNKAL